MKRRFQFSLAAVLIAITVIAGVCAGANVVYQKMVLASQREAISVEMRMATTTLHLYNDSNQRLPLTVRRSKSGEATSSWRFQLLWAIEQQDSEHPENGPFYDQAWDSPGNARFRKFRVSQFCFDHSKTEGPRATDTCVFAITGPGTAFDPLARANLTTLLGDPATRDTILLVEVRNSKTHWMQPGDFDIRTMPHTINDPVGQGISGTCDGCFCVGFADLEAWMLRNDTPFDKLALFFTIDEASKHDRNVELGPYRVK